jgi:hypothetical protein
MPKFRENKTEYFSHHTKQEVEFYKIYGTFPNTTEILQFLQNEPLKSVLCYSKKQNYEGERDREIRSSGGSDEE